MGAANDFETLLVEDNPSDVDLFTMAFEESEVPGELHVATTAGEALSRLRDDSFPTPSSSLNLVILDLNLPDANGLDVVREVRNGDGLPTIPILILSSSSDREEVNEAYERGANAYLVKRMTFDEITSLVEAVDRFWYSTAELPG